EVPLEVTIGESPYTMMETLTFVIGKSKSPYNLLLRRTTIQKMGIVVSTIHATMKFHTPRGIRNVFSTYEPNKVKEGQKKIKESVLKATMIILSCADSTERIIVTDKHPEQTVVIGKQLPTNFKRKLQEFLRSNIDGFAWTYSDMTRMPRTIMVGGQPFNTEHKLNEYKHIELVKQKKRALTLERNESSSKEVDELTKAGILREFKYQTWVANPVMVKKAKEAGGCVWTLWTPIKTSPKTDILCHKLIRRRGRSQDSLLHWKRSILLPKDALRFKECMANLSKGADKPLPFFKALKTCTDKNTIQWTADAKEAFQKMKEFIEILPMLTALIKGKVLVMYLAALIERISTVLLAEREKRQVMIYFVSMVLQGA
ncbi:hypothetical protein Tco_1260996, partial [Tanacetum coccineum]